MAVVAVVVVAVVAADNYDSLGWWIQVMEMASCERKEEEEVAEAAVEAAFACFLQDEEYQQASRMDLA